MTTTVPIHIAEIKPSGFLLLVPALFVDNTKRYWILDTGASGTVVNKDLHTLYEEIYAEVDEVYTASNLVDKEEFKAGRLNTVYFGELLVKDMKVVLLELSHLNQLYEKMNKLEVCGLLGSDFLAKYNATINYRNKTLTLQW